ncbi:MAG: helix-turn-helix domain-containing protein [Mesorhizobium sp.]|nr:MAG: helix-turn-helix domain-containing protein [Mesorhizobium sp.]TIO54442.1 MAG: helix-turn-helix domain-containing protein [Mesorhizobium sp.]TIO59475.1 MAG: helix-turn-helix domain-containing protein [Mesorhizobium sp.]TJV63943.1 MAG: helix-turn-helix domain-containing protein [Mesorhizobium sp.]
MMDARSDVEKQINGLVGKRLREARKAKHFSLEALAGKVGMSVSQLSKLETGKAPASIAALVRFGLELDRPAQYFLQSDSEMPRCLGTLVPSWDPEGRAIEMFSRLVNQKTGHDLAISVFPAGQLGPAETQVRALVNGIIDIFVESLGFFQSYSDPIKLASLPFCFDDEMHLERFSESSMFEKEVRQALRSNSVELLNPSLKWKRGPSLVLLSQTPILSPDDLKDLPIRCPENDTMFRYLEVMGCRPVVVPWNEVVDAFQDRKFAAMITNLSHVVSMRFTRFARFMTALDYRPLDLTFAMNLKRYQILAPHIQSGLEQAAVEAAEYCSNLLGHTRDLLPALLEEDGAVLCNVGVKAWRARSRQAFEEMENEGVWRRGLVEEMGALAQVGDPLEFS